MSFAQSTVHGVRVLEKSLRAECLDRIELVIRDVIGRTPVRIGLAAGSWTLGLGRKPKRKVRRTARYRGAADRARDQALERVLRRLQRWKPGLTLYLHNPVWYVALLELRVENRTPVGMVRHALRKLARLPRFAG